LLEKHYLIAVNKHVINNSKAKNSLPPTLLPQFYVVAGFFVAP